MIDKEKLDRFLEELSELSKKYSLEIRGCGCCGSPWIEAMNSFEVFENLTFKDNTYKVDD